MRGLLSIAAAAAALATSASAVNITVVDQLTGSVEGKGAYLSAILLDDVLYNCLTPNRDLFIGQQGYQFTDQGALTPANSLSLAGYSLTEMQIAQVANLVDKSQADYANGDVAATMAADASAIWRVEGASVIPDDPNLQAAIDADVLYSSTHRLDRTVEVMADLAANTQVLGAVTIRLPDGGGVIGAPEPVSWTLMLGGISLVGGALRTQRRFSPQPVAATA